MSRRLLPTIRLAGVGGVISAGVALVVVILFDVFLRLLGLGRTQRLLAGLVPLRDAPCDGDPRRDRRVAEVARALDRAIRVYRPGRMCLRRALALWASLRWRGIISTIELGVRRTETGLVGHAWVAWRGEPLHEPAGTVLEYDSFGPSQSTRTLP